MSIMERMRELESYDDNSLIEMITNGNPRYPQYAVLGEIQRREDLRRITKNQIARQNQPNMTVADRKVMEFSQGAMPMNPVNTVYNQAEPSATPAGLGSVAPTLMREGGLTQMQEGERTSLEESFDNPIFMNKVRKDMMIMSDPQPLNMDFLRSIGVIDEEGNIDAVQAGLVGLSAYPAVRATGAVLGGLRTVGSKLGLGKLATKIGEKAKDLFTRKPEFVKTKSGKIISTSTPQGKFAKTMQTNPKLSYGPRVFSPSRTLSTVGGVAVPAAVIRGMPESVGNLTGIADPQFEEVAFEGNMPMQKQPNQLTGLDQAMIGFSILASNNMTELGANMINVLQSIQARGGTDADKAQVDYLKSRTDLIRKEIANYDSTQLQTEITAVNKAIETMEETGGSPAEITGARTYLDALIKELAAEKKHINRKKFCGWC